MSHNHCPTQTSLPAIVLSGTAAFFQKTIPKKIETFVLRLPQRHRSKSDGLEPIPDAENGGHVSPEDDILNFAARRNSSCPAIPHYNATSSKSSSLKRLGL